MRLEELLRRSIVRDTNIGEHLVAILEPQSEEDGAPPTFARSVLALLGGVAVDLHMYISDRQRATATTTYTPESVHA